MSFELGSVIARLKLDSKNFKEGLSSAKKGLSGFKDNLTKIRNASLLVTGAIAGVGAVSMKLSDTAGKYAGVRKGFEAMTKGMVDSVELFEDKVRAATLGTVDDYNILTNANRALALIGKETFGDFTEDFAKMADYSRRAAMANGESVEFMFDSLVRGVGRASPLILDNLGIQIKAEEVNSKYAESIGKTVKELTSQEQKTALLQEAMLQLEGKYGEIEAPTDDYTSQMATLKTTISNAQKEIGLALIPVLVKLMQTITPIIEKYLPILINKITLATEWFKNLDPRMQKIIFAFIALAPVVAAAIALLQTIITVLGLMLSPIFLVVAAIAALIAIGVGLLKNWDKIKTFGKHMLDELALAWSGFKQNLKEMAQPILDAIMWPFEEAKRRIKDAINWIKDRLDFTKRHSPSVLDIVNRGVKQVNKAFEGLSINTGMNTNMAAAVAPVGGGGSINQITVSLDGAIISSESEAEEMGEKIGDSIIKRLQQNIRV